jgi:hypothetical protein
LLKETHVWDLGVDGRIILNNILWRGLDWAGRREGTVVGCSEQDNELPGRIKGRKFIDQLNDIRFLKNEST